MRSNQPNSTQRFILSEDAQAVIDADFEEIRISSPHGWWAGLKERFDQWLTRLRYRQ